MSEPKPTTLIEQLSKAPVDPLVHDFTDDRSILGYGICDCGARENSASASQSCRTRCYGEPRQGLEGADSAVADVAKHIRALEAERDALRERLRAVEALHVATSFLTSSKPHCNTCGAYWPCKTSAALKGAPDA